MFLVAFILFFTRVDDLAHSLACLPDHSQCHIAVSLPWESVIGARNDGASERLYLVAHGSLQSFFQCLDTYGLMTVRSFSLLQLSHKGFPVWGPCLSWSNSRRQGLLTKTEDVWVLV